MSSIIKTVFQTSEGNKDLRRFRVDEDDQCWSNLQKFLETTYGASNQYSVVYVDDDGDQISIYSALEMQESMRLSQELGAKTLKLFVSISPSGLEAKVEAEVAPEINVPEVVPEVTVPEVVPEVTVPEVVPEVTVPEVVPEVTVPEVVPKVTAMMSEPSLSEDDFVHVNSNPVAEAKVDACAQPPASSLSEAEALVIVETKDAVDADAPMQLDVPKQGLPSSSDEASVANDSETPEDAEHKLQQKTTARHVGITCDGCGLSPIEGVRFQCSVCHDYDLCERCEPRHDPTHPLLKIKMPASACMSCDDGKAPSVKKASIDAPTCSFEHDVSFPDNSRCYYNKGAELVKTWAVRNTGAQAWPQGCKLVFEKGALRPNVLQIPVSARPGEVVEISVSIPIPEPPRKSKPLKGVFSLVDAQDRRFGSLWIRVVIEPVPGMQLSKKKNKYKDVVKKAEKQQAKKLQKVEKQRLKEEQKRLKRALRQQKDAEKSEKQALQQALKKQKQLEKQQKQHKQQARKNAECGVKKAAAMEAKQTEPASSPIQQQAPVAEVAIPQAQPVLRFQRQAEMLREMGFDHPLAVLNAILQEHRGNVERVAVALLSGN